jgi:hypothetical protein
MNRALKIVLEDLKLLAKRVLRVVIVLAVIFSSLLAAGIGSFLFLDLIDVTSSSLVQYFHSVNLFNFIGSIFTLGMFSIIGVVLVIVLIYLLFRYVIPVIFLWFPIFIVNSIKSYIKSVKARAQ